ncbi:hypothetical protein Pcinc_006327 [Petrolisthes cinctipes]|uniref:Uncharacterized protein n=1 Tax=Petrolisthes cinctipes TaxID=88211 RepID=A0AAE1KYI9_PETCI|nr:hypothetical protein Pcinc_006327 [Petrolisthes cinctipes]
MSRSKQQHGQYRREEKKTGGGAPPPVVPKDVEKVLSLIAPEVNDLGCDFDDDALPALTNSYSFGTITQEAVILEVNPDDPPEPVNMPTATVVTSAETPGPSRDTTGASGCIPLSVHGKSSTTRKRRRIRRSLYVEDIYAGPEEVINTTQKEINMRQNLITHRQTLLDIQKRQAEVRLEEAEYQRQLALEKLEESEENREMNDKILKNKLIESQINRQIAEAKAAEMSLPIWL